MSNYLIVLPGAVCIKWHVLNKANFNTFIAAKRCEVDDFIIVDTALHDNIYLYWREAGSDRSIDAVQHVFQLVASRHLEEPLLLQRVEADVDPAQARVVQLLSD